MKRKSPAISACFSPTYAPWSRLTVPQRHREIVRYAQRNGGKAVSINLHPDIEAKLNKHNDPARYLSKRMNASLSTIDLRSLPILMAIEATRPEGRLHLHGVYIDFGQCRPRIHQAMRHAAGYITGRQGSRQISAKQIYFADGWSNYLGKDATWTKRILGTDQRLRWVSTPMTQLVRDHYEAERLGKKQAANVNTSMPAAI